MTYADYAYYTGTYYGTMPEEDFSRLSRRASAYLDQAALGHITPAWAAKESVKDACCAVADEMGRQERGGSVTAESNDGVSVSYAAPTLSEERRLYNAAALHLGNTGLLYRGCG